jgi:hypothetical protein
LNPTDALFDLALVLGLGQFALSDLGQLDHHSGLDNALDEAHEFSKVTWDSAIDDSYGVQHL